ncbi:hypothetical protein B5S28_g3799 [[Candida] boidinii]|nr:hypothetical protein B5S28_g3799 [[Candida] boidinii]OWB64296.1 hypothetical protein B5S29_g5360 [[Candida] boidinii]OWB74748.1 hypothetical protein B5S31_g4566 [[Candida] boidinii]OWB80377.1 hypothetical protein B5S32_g4647 [[Candida] boidinii]
MLSFKSIYHSPSSSLSTIFIRNLTKTHRSVYKRWRKTGSNGYKRGVTCRKHGNAGWSNRILGKYTGTTYSTHSSHGNQTTRLKKLLPFL